MSSQSSETTTSPIALALSWTLVGIPLLYGIYMTLLEAAALFSG